MTMHRQALARVFHALSDTKRLALIENLRGKRRCVCDLETAIGLRQSLVSFHLKVLKEAGLVTDARRGRWVYYSLAPESLPVLDALIAAGESTAGRSGGSSI
jgi:ArsR family transcriptional regulator, arsenate/arsenite/antimonite-responsive transcriptional repressor